MQLSLILQSLCEIRTRMISIFLEKKQKLRGIHKLPQVTQLINGGADIWICGVELQSPKSFSVPQICPSVLWPQDFCTLHLSLCNIASHSFTSVLKFQVEHHSRREAPCPAHFVGLLGFLSHFRPSVLRRLSRWTAPPPEYHLASLHLRLSPEDHLAQYHLRLSQLPLGRQGWEGASRRVFLLLDDLPHFPQRPIIWAIGHIFPDCCQLG